MKKRLSVGLFWMFNRKRNSLLILPVLIFYFFCSCSEIIDPKEPGSPFSNVLPETDIANVPPDNNTDNPYPYKVTLYWDGGDKDGFIIGYKYKIDEEEWIYTEESFAIIDFPSPDSINFHIFRVKAVDNDNGEDPTPATRVIYTKQTDLPETEILDSPPSEKSVFILPDTTTLWRGIEFSLGGHDSDGEIIAYEYAIDDSTNWVKTNQSVIRIFGELGDGEHLFFARAIDNAMGVDPTPVRQKFSVITPTLEKRILVVDETRDGSGSAISPDDVMVDNFYTAILSDYDYLEYDLKAEGAIDAATLANFDIVIWHDDDRAENLLKDYIDEVKDYLTVGGKFFLSGWRALENVDNIVSENYIYKKGDFGYSFLYLESFKLNKEKDFTGGKGINDYPDLHTDPNKMSASYEGKLNYCAVITPFELTDVLLSYDSAEDNQGFEGKPCAVKYFSDTYRAIALGFPLYVIQEDEAKTFMKKAIEDLRK